jgi:transposase
MKMPKPCRILGREASAESGERKESFAEGGGAVETVPRKARRTFSAAERLRIVKDADACLARGERGGVGALLRREGVYSSQLSTWRMQLGAGGAGALERHKPGRKPKFDAKDREIERLTKQLARAEEKLYVANALIELQKKAHSILGLAVPMLDRAAG